jgi:uncharacterized protein YndB with AHSA1/START domain
MDISVEATVHAPIEKVWSAYTTPEDIIQWNAASDDWHTTSSEVDLRVGGAFLVKLPASCMQYHCPCQFIFSPDCFSQSPC